MYKSKHFSRDDKDRSRNRSTNGDSTIRWEHKAPEKEDVEVKSALVESIAYRGLDFQNSLDVAVNPNGVILKGSRPTA